MKETAPAEFGNPTSGRGLETESPYFRFSIDLARVSSCLV